MSTYQVVYTSKTGNTKKLAEKIYDTLNSKDKEIYSLDEGGANADADIYFIGFWTNRGTCSMEVLDFFDNLEGKKIALFGTCGMGGQEEYFNNIKTNVAAFLPDSAEFLGAFMCQGEMPDTVGEKYHNILREHPDDEKIKFMIDNFNHAIGHPDAEDLDHIATFVKDIEGGVS
ncbi:MAG: flavodoxin family protein BilS [Anaerostipes sp.]|jgi:flavodoxin I|nr:flavodoxin family protein [Anaerostipes sp.]